MRSLLAHPVDVVSHLTCANQTVTFPVKKDQQGAGHSPEKILLPIAIHVYGCNAEKHPWGYWVTPHNTQSSLGEGEGSWAQSCIN